MAIKHLSDESDTWTSFFPLIKKTPQNILDVEYFNMVIYLPSAMHSVDVAHFVEKSTNKHIIILWCFTCCGDDIWFIGIFIFYLKEAQEIPSLFVRCNLCNKKTCVCTNFH